MLPKNQPTENGILATPDRDCLSAGSYQPCNRNVHNACAHDIQDAKPTNTVAEEQHAKPLGHHTLIDFYDCRTIPSSSELLEEIMVHAAELTGATVVDSTFHEFSPYGLSGMVVLAESHLAVHTWPEHASVCVDLFSCSPHIIPEPGIKYLQKKFTATRIDSTAVPRGVQTRLSPAKRGMDGF